MTKHNHHNHEHHHAHGAKAFIAPAISLLMLGAGIAMIHLNSRLFVTFSYAEPLWFLLAFLPVGLPVIKEAWEGIMSKDIFNEFTLMVTACIGAFCIGEYPEAVGVMLFYSIGETMQHGAVDRATRNISCLLDVRSERARVVAGHSTTETDPATVDIGQIIEVRPGERVPLDGALENSDALFDTSALTGESVPRNIIHGEEVLAGMISSTSTVRIRVNKRYGQSTLARILDLVNHASERKAHSELFIRKFARIYTPAVIAMATLVVAVPWIIGMINPSFHYIFSEWLYRALVFLVISCPCALVISVPLGYYAGIGAASRAGILFKGGNYLEAITHINVVAFDKTGTLTTGQFSVEQTVCAPTITDNELLPLMASAETESSHPLAKALVNYVKSKGLNIYAQEDMKEITGQGTIARVNGHIVAVGNIRLMQSQNVKCPAGMEKESRTLMVCGVDGEFAGYVVMADTIKPDSATAVAELKKAGIDRIVMLSGDKQEIVSRYADCLGIDEAHGELLPQDKAAYVEKMASTTDLRIAFVGDGMNDAPVLALSNVGIAMGGLGSDAAIESADVVIQTDSPSRVATAIRIGRTTRHIVTQNIIGAIAVKLIILALGLAGYASLWSAVFADVGVALLAVINSMRIMWKHYR